jgi:hypothetical protein
MGEGGYKWGRTKGKGRGRNGLRLNIKRQVLWISYNFYRRKKEVRKAELEKK